MHRELYLYHFDCQPDISELEVKKKDVRVINGYEFTFRIIGSSHYIDCEELGVYELLSCKETDKESTAVVELSTETHQCEVVDCDSNDVTVTTELSGESLDAFDVTDEHDLLYKFGEDAYTTITWEKMNNKVQYETYHTYPEFDVAFYSESTIVEAQQ